MEFDSVLHFARPVLHLDVLAVTAMNPIDDGGYIIDTFESTEEGEQILNILFCTLFLRSRYTRCCLFLAEENFQLVF